MAETTRTDSSLSGTEAFIAITLGTLCTLGAVISTAANLTGLVAGDGWGNVTYSQGVQAALRSASVLRLPVV